MLPSHCIDDMPYFAELAAPLIVTLMISADCIYIDTLSLMFTPARQLHISLNNIISRFRHITIATPLDCQIRFLHAIIHIDISHFDAEPRFVSSPPM